MNRLLGKVKGILFLFKRLFKFNGPVAGLWLYAMLTSPLPVHAGNLLPSLANANVAVTDASNLFNANVYGQWYLNTDNGHIYAQYSNYPWDDKGPGGQLVSQSGGPDVWVWNFSNLNITANLKIQGSHPAVILSSGDIGVNAAVVVEAGGQAGGIGGKNTDSNSNQNTSDDGGSGIGPTGGLGGQGGGHIVDPYPPNPWNWILVYSGGGGGGGFYSPGQDAPTDAPIMPYIYDSNTQTYAEAPPALQYLGGNGGSATIDFSVLSGGGGGGGGGDGSGWGGGGSTFSAGGNGGAGGGAILFATPGSLTIGTNGSVSVNGQNPAYIGAINTEGSGGGGAGGYAAFSIGGTFSNDGSITARGAYGSYSNGLLHDPATSAMGGAGSGGYVAIEADILAKSGTISVAGGDGSNATAGHITLASAPGAPTDVIATPGNGQVSVSFTAPADDGGSAITGYTATSSPGGFTGTGGASPITVTGLSNGTAYTFTVTATNSTGTGPASTASNSATPVSSTVSGACGGANGVASSFPPETDLCSSGTATLVLTSSANRNYTWTCLGSNGGTDAQCSADWSETGSSTGQGSASVGGGDNWVFAPSGNGTNQTGGFIPMTGNAKSPSSPPPSGLTFPEGLYDFVLNNGTAGGTATVTITFPDALPSNAEYWKFGPTPSGYNCSGTACATAHWYRFPNAVFSGNQVTLTITDGGVGDDDLTANGVIVDQGGPAIPVTTSIPTLSEWGLMILSTLLGLRAMYALRSGRTAKARALRRVARSD